MRYPSAGSWQLFVNNNEPIGWVLLRDSPSEGLKLALQSLQKNNLKVSLLSGDRVENVAEFAQGICFDTVVGGASPSEKLNYLYVVTPKGISEKTKLSIKFMQRKMKEYDELKNELEREK